MTKLDPCMSLERIKKNLVVLGVVDMRQLLPCFEEKNRK